MVKVDVISGFLGAGKTTLIKKLFESKISSEKTVIIENEFGEIGIDGSFLKEAGVQIREINSGCICCSLVGDFEESMKEVIRQFTPDRIIIEPSGVGKLSDIVRAIETVDAPLELNIVCTVVDGGKCRMYIKNFGEFYIDQVKEAFTVVVSKADKLPESKIAEAVEQIRGINSECTIITTPITQLTGDKLLEVLEEGKDDLKDFIEKLKSEHEDDEDECCHHHHHHHHEDGEECHCHHHHDDDDDDDEDEHEHHHHHDDDTTMKMNTSIITITMTMTKMTTTKTNTSIIITTTNTNMNIIITIITTDTTRTRFLKVGASTLPKRLAKVN